MPRPGWPGHRAYRPSTASRMINTVVSNEFVTSSRSPPDVVAERDDQVQHNINNNHVFLRLGRDEDFS
jgi:hypothetical protein